jgi:hypothetical protein
MVLKPLAIDSTLNSTLDDILNPHFRKRSLAKMGKFPKKNQKCPLPFLESEKQKKSRLKSDFSNLVKSRFPDLKGSGAVPALMPGKDLDLRRATCPTSHANHPGPSPAVQKKITPHIPTEIFGPQIFSFPPYFSKVVRFAECHAF